MPINFPKIKNLFQSSSKSQGTSNKDNPRKSSFSSFKKYFGIATTSNEKQNNTSAGQISLATNQANRFQSSGQAQTNGQSLSYYPSSNPVRMQQTYTQPASSQPPTHSYQQASYSQYSNAVGMQQSYPQTASYQQPTHSYQQASYSQHSNTEGIQQGYARPSVQPQHAYAYSQQNHTTQQISHPPRRATAPTQNTTNSSSVYLPVRSNTAPEQPYEVAAQSNPQNNSSSYESHMNNTKNYQTNLNYNYADDFSRVITSQENTIIQRTPIGIQQASSSHTNSNYNYQSDFSPVITRQENTIIQRMPIGIQQAPSSHTNSNYNYQSDFSPAITRQENTKIQRMPIGTQQNSAHKTSSHQQLIYPNQQASSSQRSAANIMQNGINEESRHLHENPNKRIFDNKKLANNLDIISNEVNDYEQPSDLDELKKISKIYKDYYEEFSTNGPNKEHENYITNLMEKGCALVNLKTKANDGIEKEGEKIFIKQQLVLIDQEIMKKAKGKENGYLRDLSKKYNASIQSYNNHDMYITVTCEKLGIAEEDKYQEENLRKLEEHMKKELFPAYFEIAKKQLIINSKEDDYKN